jgi:transposase
MPATTAQNAIAVVGVDIGKNSFHIVALDDRGAIVLRQKWSRSQMEARFANMPPCLIVWLKRRMAVAIIAEPTALFLAPAFRLP